MLFRAACRLLPSADCRLPTAFCLLFSACYLLGPGGARAQEPVPEPPPDEAAVEDETPLPGDWAVDLLDRVVNSSSPEARDALYRAVMATGSPLVPQLEEALKDDRTAEFAAQALAYIGGEKALQILWGLTSDPRDLNLRRFYYGALGEFDSPEATETLLEVIKRADQEADRTVTEAAILALTVRSDSKLVAPLRETEKDTRDVVIRLDLENAIEVIERRAKYLALPQKKAGGSVEYAIRTYFAPALESAPSPADLPPPAPRPSPARTRATRPLARPVPAPPTVNVRIENITLSPDKTRALARVLFEDASATASYDIVLQKRYGDWTVATVWLGSETEKVLSKPDLSEPEVK